uniref:SHSP domain-containing protein n=1 Tax=Ascaris lumbricoides TaxID=6252 RepID=A0A0M3IKF0_ASCLU
MDKVKVIKDQLVIHCMHESRTDEFGEIRREISRTYQLPPDVDTKTLKSNLTARGHLEMSTIPVSHNWVGELWDWPLQSADGVVKVTNTTEKFEVGLDVQYFTPNEIEVKVSGQELLINCRHEVRADAFGTVAREVHRAYKLPADVDVATLKSHLSSRGVLTITANKR